TQNVTVTITGNNTPAEVWIATTQAGSGDWNTGTNWETGLAPTAGDDVIIVTNQLVGETPLYPVTINSAAFAKSLVMNDFGTVAPVLNNNSTLSIGGKFDLLAESNVNNAGTINVGGALEVENTSHLTNNGSITLASGGDFKDQSSVINSGAIEVAGGTLNVLVDMANAGGQITVDGAARLKLNNAAIDGGAVTNN